MTDETPPQTPPDETPRRLTRSGSDALIGGVSSGLGRYFSIDPLLFRIGFVVLTFAGGFGVLAYLLLLAFVPADGEERPGGTSKVAAVAGAVVLGIALVTFLGTPFFFFGPGLLVIALVGLAGVLLWRAFGGDTGGDPARTIGRFFLVFLVAIAVAGAALGVGLAAALGGGVVIASLAVVTGLALIATAFVGGMRWLIVPALAMAFGVGVVSAADVDLDGGHGDRTYAPRSLADLRDNYQLGAGSLEVDLRNVDFTGGAREVELEVGFGEAVLVVPRDVCVVADADVGAGYLRVLEWDDGGFNVGWEEGDAARADARLVVDAHVGMGALQVVHDPRDAEGHDDRWDGPRGRWEDLHEDDEPALGRSAACEA